MHKSLYKRTGYAIYKIIEEKKLHENLFFFGKITKYKQIEKNLVQKTAPLFVIFRKKSIRPEMFLRTVSRIKDFEEIFLFKDITGASGGGNPKPKFHWRYCQKHA